MIPAGTDLLFKNKILFVQPETAEATKLHIQERLFCTNFIKTWQKNEAKLTKYILVCLPTITKCGLFEINPQFDALNVTNILALHAGDYFLNASLLCRPHSCSFPDVLHSASVR